MPESAAGPDPAALLRLATWFSPAFPIGAFAWSHGLESAIADGLATDAGKVREWISLLIDAGSGWNDLVIFAEAFHARDDPGRLAAVAELSLALAGTGERRAETAALGMAFCEAVLPWGEQAPASYPVAAATAAAQAGIPLGSALVAYANGFAAGLLAAATRLVPLGQREAVRILKDMEALILDAADRAARSSLDDLGSAAILSDIAAMRHETLGTRLFRS